MTYLVLSTKTMFSVTSLKRALTQPKRWTPIIKPTENGNSTSFVLMYYHHWAFLSISLKLIMLLHIHRKSKAVSRQWSISLPSDHCSTEIAVNKALAATQHSINQSINTMKKYKCNINSGMPFRFQYPSLQMLNNATNVNLLKPV